MPKPLHAPDTASWWYSTPIDRRDDGWHVTIVGIDPVWTAGPLPDADTARRQLVEQLARWERKARATGGHIAVQADGVLVTLPRMSGKPKGALPNWRRPRG